MYLMKTLNTDRLSLNLTLKRSEEKKLRALIADFTNYFDYIFIDFPPSSSRLSEILLDLSDSILLVVGLDILGLEGFSNSIQYFVDTDIDLAKIKYIIPMGYNKVRIAPNNCLKQLKLQAEKLTPHAKLTTPIKDKAIVQNLQSEGISVFDKTSMKDKFHQKNFEEIKKNFQEVYDSMNLD